MALNMGLLFVLLLTGAFAALGVHLYRKDTWGVRTEMAKFFPGNFEKQNLTENRFTGAWLPYANFKGAVLREAEFADANAQHADFSGADFTMAGVSGANFSHARFDGANLDVARGQETAIYRYASFQIGRAHV